MPTLLEINVTCNQGSTGRIAENVGLMMKQHGWNSYYAHGARRVGDSKLNTIPFSSIKAEYFHAINGLLLDGDGLGSKKQTRNLIKKISEISPDIVHIHNIHGFYLNYPILFEYLANMKIPIVLTLHDCWNFTGHCTHFLTSQCDKWQYGCKNCPQHCKKPNRSVIDKSSANYILKRRYFTSSNIIIVAVSDWLNGILDSSFLANNRRMVIHNGINLSVFKPLDRTDRHKLKILGVANVWDKNKGFYDILELRKMLPLEKFDITLVGLSRKQISSLPIGIEGIPNSSNLTELARLYSESDVLVNPTYADTFPTVNLESIACGTPVVTYRTGGSPESVTTSTGVVVDCGDLKALSEELLCFNSKNFNRMRCREYAEKHFDKEKCFFKYCQLFKAIYEST